ncbi:alpha,alpha-trehalase [Pontibacter ummariensis]|uniref:Alpha,alpha-trehalase n=1 Tax=Pontibacter ummariensis TaxID=1610492 RepID=A0A239BDT5_9BACT|nr:alpha,alpha-trehalase TreF [Pontibacter ummariensis]PRY16469.1 alpha,alpha-trehalase [Pontibacter ummariensis]SNS05721.1 alpha,alpha-trehalase [Pontibacter ummariensis]
MRRQNKNTFSTLTFFLLLLLPFTFVIQPLRAQELYRPEQDLGELFEQVQMQRIFPDSKTFPDATPLAPPQEILQAYRQQRNQPGFELKAFVTANFKLPPEPASGFTTDTSLSVIQHVERLWPLLTRDPGAGGGSLIPLPKQYIVPGGRFREIYYWDSFFTMLGLQASGETDLIQSMVDNFTHLINTTGHIPNGNRTYYLSRSQPPFYALMLQILAQQKGKEVLKTYAPALRKEYAFWMDGAEQVSAANPTHRRVVRLPDGSILNRYWDDQPEPRPESYREDVELAEASGRKPEDVYRNIRAAAESGWDFSSRWFADEENLSTIQTTDLIPVDLNALLYHVELTLAEMAALEGNEAEAKRYKKLAKARRKALLKYNWNEEEDFFYDYNFVKGTTTNIPTLASVFPLYFNMAKKKQAAAVARKLEEDFLKPGGLVTTLNRTGQQWDAPNGWAPLQWMSIQALRNYKYDQLADEITQRWVEKNEEVFHNTGKLMEKYNVVNMDLEAGGGEYPNQDGFGWTNGVLLKLISLHPELLDMSLEELELEVQE